MKLLDRKTSADLTKLLVFVVVTTLATGMLVVVIGNITFGAKREYSAVFVDATGVVKGDDIRVAGVKVGTVSDVEVVDRTHAEVTFSVAETSPVTTGTHAAIRYRNLVGQRYIALSQPDGAGRTIAEGETIPLGRTSPALDLTVLFNGFKPLFAALNPKDVNKLSYEIIRVFQGEGGTVESLLGHTASVTSTLAGRDKLVGDLIDNLNETLVHIGNRDRELTELIKSFRTLVGGLKDDRRAILGSLESVSRLSVETSDLVADIRRPFVNDVEQLRRLTEDLDRPGNKAELDRALQVLPIKLKKIGRTATYGSWFNFYLCGFTGRVKLPGGAIVPTPRYSPGSGRCDLG